MAGFCEVFDDVTKQGTKIPSNLYLKEGTYPIIDQGQTDIAGYANIKEGLFTDVPAIIFGDHTRIIKYVDTPCFLGADGVKLLKAKDKKANYKYLYYALCNARIPSTGYNRHFKWLKEIEVPDYSEKEQKEIVEKLEKIDHLISLRKQQLAKLDELVKARFVEMFGDIIHNTRAWPIYVFSDITSSRLGKMLDAKQQTGKYSFPYLANFNVQWFCFETDSLNKMDFNEKDQIEFELCDGDLLVCEGGEIGRCAVWHNEVQSCFFQKALHRVRCNLSTVLPDYLAWWFKYNCDHGGFADIEGAKATIAHLPGAKLKKLNVAVPPLELQERFASSVEKVGRQKLTIQQSLDKLEVLKKTLMQEYFG